MKKRIYQVTALAAGSLVLSAAVHGSEVSDVLYDSAMTGGSMLAMATASLGNIGQLLSTTSH